MRSASASALLVVATLAGCVTSPPRLPPRRVAFSQQLSPPAARPPDTQLPAQAPVVHERYTAWTMGADLVSVFPLSEWLVDPDKFYFAAPTLLLAPMIHAAHGELTTAAGSLAMRGGMLGVMYLAREAAEQECADSEEFICIPFGSIMLIAASYTAVTLVDAIFLSRRTRRVDDWDRLPVKPTIGMTADGRKWLSLGGRF